MHDIAQMTALLRVAQQREISFDDMQHEFAQGFRACAAFAYAAFRFAYLLLGHGRKQSLKSVRGLLPGLAFAFQQTDEMPETFRIVPLNGHGAVRVRPPETKTAQM